MATLTGQRLRPTTVLLCLLLGCTQEPTEPTGKTPDFGPAHSAAASVLCRDQPVLLHLEDREELGRDLPDPYAQIYRQPGTRREIPTGSEIAFGAV
jgi:hypothetical protein